MSDGTITKFIHQLRDGNVDAATPIWRHFYERLVTKADSRINTRVRRVVDGDDVAQAVFSECFRGIQAGRFPELHDRDNLWALLIEMATRRASNANRDERAAKRGGGAVGGESAFLTRSGLFTEGFNGIEGDEPTPEFALEVAEELEQKLSPLEPDARQVAELKMSGHTNREISERLGFSIAKVERKLALIRERWESL